MYESTERREAIALANRDRRKAGAAAGRPPKKRKKVNRFRVAVIAAGIIVVAAVAVSIVYAANAAGTGSGFLAISDGQPEFFSTIRPDAGEADGSTASGAEDGAAASAAPTSEFDGALFVGDSLTAQLETYVEEGAGSETILHDAIFLTSDNYSWGDAVDELDGGEGSLYLSDAEDASAVTLSAAIEQTGARKLYIQLGKEDLIYNDVATVTERAKTVLSALKSAYPSLEITVQSVTPMLEWIDYEGLSSTTIAEYNAEMKTYCAANNMGFADVAAFFTDGYLPAEYCADPGQLCIHLNDAGCALWTSYLLGEISPEPTPSPEPSPDGTEASTEENSAADDTGADGEAAADAASADSSSTDVGVSPASTETGGAGRADALQTDATYG